MAGSRRFATLLAAGLCAAALPARANWAYTRWGMTPDQVIAASSGGAHPATGAEHTRNDADHWEIAAAGSYRDGDLTYPVGFMFSTQGAGLRCVLYNATDANVARLTARMIATLGRPASDDSFAGIRTVKWRAPDDVELVTLENPPRAAVTHCAPNR